MSRRLYQLFAREWTISLPGQQSDTDASTAVTFTIFGAAQLTLPACAWSDDPTCSAAVDEGGAQRSAACRDGTDAVPALGTAVE